MITDQSSYDEVAAEVEAAVADVVADMPDVNPDDVFHDVAVSLLWDADPDVVEQFCTAHFGWVPPDLRRVHSRRTR